MKGAYKIVELSKIHPDENQPRKDFNAQRLAELKASIKEYGIMEPMSVEDLKNGNYILVDGERRYRVAKELNLKEVPVMVTRLGSATERLVKQFHLQEQHQGWTSLEKAIAVGQLADEMGMDIRAMSRLLSIPERTIADYEAFYLLSERKKFEKFEIPVHLAVNIRRVVQRAKSIYEDAFEEEFSVDMVKSLESALMVSIKNGGISNAAPFTKLADAFRADPDTIKKFIAGKETVTKLYLESSAKVATHARNVRQLSGLVNYHIGQLVALDGVELLRGDGRSLHELSKLKVNIEPLINQLT